jgi:hypothetical protein
MTLQNIFHNRSGTKFIDDAIEYSAAKIFDEK